MEYDGPVGQEFESIINLIIDYRQPELEKLDPKNSLLELKLTRKCPDSADFSYSPGFAEKFESLPLNKGIEKYYHLLDNEVNRLKNNLAHLQV